MKWKKKTPNQKPRKKRGKKEHKASKQTQIFKETNKKTLKPWTKNHHAPPNNENSNWFIYRRPNSQVDNLTPFTLPEEHKVQAWTTNKDNGLFQGLGQAMQKNASKVEHIRIFSSISTWNKASPKPFPPAPSNSLVQNQWKHDDWLWVLNN